MPRQRAHQQGDICYQTGKHWRTLVHLIRPKSGKAGHYLTEIKIQLKQDRVLIVLKKDSPGGPQVAFVSAEDFDGAIWVLAQEITSKKLRWRVDEWEIRRVDKKPKKG